ncbi:MAG: hypothetical protein B7Z55_15090, partial [Planctomycetales bacterium 12-60-4]
NLKQIGLAMHNYHDSANMFPVTYGFSSLSGGGVDYSENGRGHSWFQFILPHIDQAPLYNKIDFNVGYASGTNNTVAKTRMNAFICPTDPGNPGLLAGRANISNVEYAVQNYKAVAGSNWAWGVFQPVTSTMGRNRNSTNGLDAGNGLMCRGASGTGPQHSTNIGQVRDGTSNTFAVGEALPARCTHTSWYHFNHVTATCAVPLNYYQKDQTIAPTDWPNNYSFASTHVGGGHFLMADGAVKFISENIDLTMYRNLATISGDEVATIE